MTAAYGLPDHLFTSIAYAVQVAFENSVPGEAEFDGRDMHELTALWHVRVENEIHTDLLTPEYAHELLAVVRLGIADNIDWMAPGDRYFDDEYAAALDLDFASEEIVASLTEIVESASVAA